MITPLVLQVISQYQRKLRDRFGERLRFVRLFGSYARGQASEDSDIDIAVVIEGLTRDEWNEAISISVEVEITTDITLSPFVLSSERFDELARRERRIALDILREGIAS